ncbi:hypothetical protein SDC9_139545 [bioreactor metagenome]|uniref:Uncharacterized protein n=1 Tax=bioreactor metagenome TaxID=1076179 RepID=A0A645DSE4_9ZZZZ
MKRRFLKCVVIGLFIAVLVFTGIMIWLFYLYQSVPNSLVYAFFGFCGGEAFFSSLIKRADVEDSANPASIEDDSDSGNESDSDNGR